MVKSARARPTATVEDYLETIHRLERDGKKVIATRLAEMLNVSLPTATLTLKRMARDGWIVFDQHKQIRLTPAGETAAHSVIRRHMLTEWLLVKTLDVPWSEVHSEAHQIEHTLSDNVEKRLNDNLNRPSTCPHGNPLPDHEELISHWRPLTKAPYGTAATIRRIHETIEDSRETLKYLEQNGLLPGAKVEILENLAFNQTISLRTEKGILSLGWALAENIFVETDILG